MSVVALDKTPRQKRIPMDRFKEYQKDIDAIAPYDYETFRALGPNISERTRQAAYAAHPALRRYDEGFDKVLAEVKEAEVKDRPAVWLVYNMGLVVKTRKTTFAIDLAHRQGLRIEPLLDFALVTHNHDDHVDAAFLRAMDRNGKTVISNFLANYGAVRAGRMPGGYTRRRKVFKIGDVTIRATVSDHNRYLVDFTTAFEISVGGWTLYHTGDSANIAKLRPLRRPDLWVVHPRCGLDVADGVRKFHPRLTALCHLCELGHASNQWRWRLSDGRDEAAKVRAADPEAKAVVPFWGERI